MANTAPREIQNLNQEIKPVSSGWLGNLGSWLGQSQMNWAGEANTDVEKEDKRGLLAWRYEPCFPILLRGHTKSTIPALNGVPPIMDPLFWGNS